jgi:autotransporter-associated beta strand protein
MKTAVQVDHNTSYPSNQTKRPIRFMPFAFLLFGGALLLSVEAARAQQDGTWTADSDGNWSDTTMWLNGLVATGATYTATFNFDITANHTVTLDTPVTIGTVIFGDTGGNSLWTLRTLNSSVLTMDNGVNKPKIRAIQPGTGFRCNVVIAGTNGFRGPDTQDGVLALGATNTYTGDTEISRNILKINADGAIPSGAGYGNVMLLANVGNPGNTSKLDLNTFSPTINGLNSDFDPVANPNYYNPPLVYSSSAGSAVTLTVGAGNANGEFGGNIQNGSRPVGLTKIGTGTQSLTNVNDYTGPTTISAGTLNYAAAGSSGNSPITVAATGTLKIQQAAADTTWTGYSGTFNSGTLVIDLGSNPISTWNPPVTFSFGITISATPTITITGPTVPNGTYPLIKYTTAVTGVGLLPDSVSLPGGGFGTLQDNIGTQTIDLVVGGPVPPNIHWATGNGTWDTSTFNWRSAVGSTNYVEGVPVQFKDVDATGNPVVTLNSSVQPASVLVNATKNYTLTGSGSIDGSASLTKVGTGAVTLDLASGFTGGAAISQGTVNVKKAAAFGSASGALTMLGGALDNTSAGPLTLLDYPQAWNGDFAFVGTHDLDMGSGSVTLNAARTVTVNASTLRVGGSFSFGSQYNFAKAGAGTLRLDGAVGTMIGNVTVNAGTLILSATNSFVGDTRIVAGNLVVASSNALLVSTLNLAPTDAGTWSFSTLTNVILGSLKGNRPLGLTNASGAALALYVGRKNTGTTVDSYYGTLSGPGSLTKVGGGTWQMGGGGGQGSGTYSGDTTVVSGTLQPGRSDVFPHGAGKGNFIIESSGTFDFLDRGSFTFNGLFGDGTINTSDLGGLSSPNQTLTVGDGNANGSFSGVIHEWPKGGKTAGKISLVKIGTGTQVLGGVSSYSRDTIVNGGTLQVDGTLYDTNDIPATVTVNANATLAGSGIIKGPVVVSNGGTIGAGASAGLLTLWGGLDLSAGGTDVWELAALKDDSDGTAGTDFDQILMTVAAPTLDGSSTLSIRFIDAASAPDGSNPFWQSTHRWTIISAPGAASNFAVIQNGAYSAGIFTTSVEAGGIVLTFTPGFNMSIAAGPGSNLTLSYWGGTGSQFVLLQTNNVAAPLNLWKRTQTNTSPTGSFTVTPGSDPREFYRVTSE